MQSKKELKCRTWNTKSKYFKYWGFIQDKEFDNTPYFEGPPSGGSFVYPEIKNNTTLYINLNDIEGNEIYENDLVIPEGCKDKDLILIVTWDEKLLRYVYATSKTRERISSISSDDRMKIVGNIYEGVK